MVIGIDDTGGGKSNYQMITTTTVPLVYMNVWVSDCWLTASEYILFATWWLEQASVWWDDDTCFVPSKHALLEYYSAISLKQHSTGRHDVLIHMNGEFTMINKHHLFCTVNFYVSVKVWNRPSWICGILYYKVEWHKCDQSCRQTLHYSVAWHHR